MDSRQTHGAPCTPSAQEVAAERVVSAAWAHLRGEVVVPVYLATGQQTRSAVPVLGRVAAAVRAAERGDRLLVCTGAGFAALWRDTFRHGMTPFVRRALDAKYAILLDGLEALHDEPVAHWELARLITPGRLVVLSGPGHLSHVAAWSSTLAGHLAGAAGLCLHAGPCFTDADAWVLIDRVAAYYGLTRAALLSRRRPAHIALARQVAMRLLHTEGLTATRVGRLLQRDHATVLHGDARIRHLAAGRPDVQYDLDALRRAIAA